MIDTALLALAGLGFVTLFVTALRRHVRDGQPGALELAQVLGLYALLALLTGVRQLEAVAWTQWWGWLAAVAIGFATIPLLMVRFARAFRAIPGGVWRGTKAATPLLAAGALLYVFEVLGAPLEDLWLLVFLVAWAAAHGLAAAGLWRGGSAASVPVARQRGQIMAGAMAGLGLLMPLAGALGMLGRGSPITGLLVYAVLIVGLLQVGFVPPGPLRWYWARHEREELAEAQRALLGRDDPDRLAADLLPHVARLAGGRRAWLCEAGEPVASTPPGAPPPPRVRDEAGHGGRARPPAPGSADRGGDHDPASCPPATDPAERGVRVETAADGSRLLLADTGYGPLIVEIHPYALLLGARDLDAVAGLAVQLGVAVDRARLRAQELASVQALEQARRVAEVERVRDDVLATVSHEMRTPLTTVCGLSAVLTERWDQLPEDRRRELTQRVASNAEDLRTVVEQVLDLTAHRLAAGASSPPEPVDLPALVGDVREGLRRDPGDDRPEVDVPASPQPRLDRAAVAQILHHLLSNALQFSDAGQEVRVSGAWEGTALRLRVEDQGRGMDEEDLARAFEPFYRAGDVLRRETRGLGLGLALVAALAERIGAEVDVASAPGEGTTVTVTLPHARPRSTSPGPANADVGGGRRDTVAGIPRRASGVAAPSVGSGAPRSHGGASIGLASDGVGGGGAGASGNGTNGNGASGNGASGNGASGNGASGNGAGRAHR